MRIITYNVNGLRARLKKDFVYHLSTINSDIICLNETKLTEEDNFDFPLKLDEYHTYYSNSKVKKGYSGVAILSKIKPVKVEYGINDNNDDEGRCIIAYFKNFILICTYVPNSGPFLQRLDYKKEYLRALLKKANYLNLILPVIITGDFNVAHTELDIYNPDLYNGTAGFTIEERLLFSSFINNGFVDTFRYLYPSKKEYTWWSYQNYSFNRNAGWRIDYFLISQNLKDNLQDVIIYKEIRGADHAPIELNIEIEF